MVKVRHGQVANRPGLGTGRRLEGVYAPIELDLEGHKDVLGMWAGEDDPTPGGVNFARFTPWRNAKATLEPRTV
jgi:putative transposase